MLKDRKVQEAPSSHSVTTTCGTDSSAQEVIVARNQPQELLNYSLLPSKHLENRMKYFYGPYNSMYQATKGMRFEVTGTPLDAYENSEKKWDFIRNTIFQKDKQYLSCVKDALRQINRDPNSFALPSKRRNVCTNEMTG